jgi:predicted RNA methylase
MNNQDKGLKRIILDKFYTKKNIVEICIYLFKQYILIDNNCVIIEPSAGNGSFIHSIKSLTNNYLFYDISPENSEIITQDYLEINTESIKKTYKDKKIHILGNPPFGRQSSLAIKFIKKSCEFCDTISFILPKSFKKESLKNKIPMNFHNILEIDLPVNAFLVNEKEHDVPCIFQIWEKKDIKRNIIEKEIPIHFKFVKKYETPDISFRRVGVNAGKIDINIIDKSEQSHYFIKFIKNTIEENIKQLEKLHFDFNNTVGPKSISKPEVVLQFNVLLS